MKKRRGFLRLAIFLGMLFFVWSFVGGCLPLTASAQPETVRVGILLPLSGPAAPIGTQSLQAHQLAVKHINEKGGIETLGGAKIELVVADSTGDPRVGVTEAERLITSEKVKAILGAYQSSVTFPSTQIAEKYHIPYIVPSAYSPEITARGFKYTFRICVDSNMAAKEQLAFLKRMGDLTGVSVKTLGLVYENTDWGISSAEAWKEYAPEFGMTVVADESYQAASANLDPVVQSLATKKPDALLYASYASDAILLANGLAEREVDVIAQVATGGGHADPTFVQNVGWKADYIFDLTSTAVDVDFPQVREVNDEYKGIHDVDMSDDAVLCYTGTWVLKKALELAESTEGAALQKVLSQMILKPGQEGILVPFDIDFGPDGQNQHAGMVTVQYQEGRRVTVFPVEIALPGMSPVWPQPKWSERK